MTEIKTRAIVINSIKYGESDLIITFLTEEYGIMKGMARGAVRSRKRFAGCFEPFTHISLCARLKPSGALASVVSADIIDAHYGIREDFDRISAGAAILEVTASLDEPGDGQSEAFPLLRDTIGLLEESTEPFTLAACYLIKYIKVSGYNPSYESCAVCGSPLTGKASFYTGGQGLCCMKCAGNRGLPLSPGTIAFIKQAENIDPDKMARFRASAATRGELFSFLRPYIQDIAGRRLKSLDNFNLQVENP